MQLSVRETARLLKVSETTVYRWIRKGSIPASQINDQVRLSRAELLEWASSHNIPVSPEMFQEPEGADGQVSGLFQALKAGGILYGIKGADKPAVLHGVVAAIPFPEDMDRQFLCQILLAREALGSTAIGNGIAIPHVRHPIVMQLTEPMITLCFLQRAIDFGAPDGKPVDKLFMLFSPTVKLHLQLLSKLIFLLRSPEFWGALVRAAPAEELLSIVQRTEGSVPRTGKAS